MNDWEKRFREHSIHKLIDEIKALHVAGKLTTHDPAVVLPYKRLLHVLIYFEDIVDSIDPQLVTNLNPFDQMIPPATAARNFLQSFYSDNSLSTLTNANAQADQLLNILSAPILTKAQLQPKSLTRGVKEFSSAVIEVSDNMKLKQDEAQKQFEDFKGEITRQKDKIVEHDRTIETQKTRIDNIISQLQDQFSQAEERRRVEFDKHTTERAKLFTDLIDGIKEKGESFFEEKEEEYTKLCDDLNKKGDSIISVLLDKRDEASNLVNIIGNIGVSGQYDNFAIADRKSANRWRGIALSFMVLLVIGAIATVFYALSSGYSDWRMTGIRIFTTLTLAIPAFYAARESSKHRRAEQRLRKMHLELASINPYLEVLPEATRNELKAKLTEKFFGQPEPPEKEDEPLSIGSLYDLLKMVLQNITKK